MYSTTEDKSSNERISKDETFVPSAAALGYAFLLAGPFLGVLWLSKAMKVASLADTHQFTGFWASIGQDFLLAALLLPVLAVVLERLLPLPDQRFLKPAIFILGVLHLLVAGLTFAAVVEHAFFLVTGSVMDGYIFAVSLHNAGRNLEVMQSEMNLTRSLAFLAPFVVNILPFLVWKRYYNVFAGKNKKIRTVFLSSVLLLALIGVVGVNLQPDSILNPLSDNIFIGLVKDAFGVDIWDGKQERISGNPLREGPKKLRKNGMAAAKNIIVIVLESTAAQQTSLYNESRDTTPFLKSLAARGAKVEHAYTSVPHTTKALVSVNCGIYPWLTPSTEEAKFGAIPTACLAKLLRDQGFATAYFQSAEENYERRADLVKEFGFETFVGKESIPPKDKDGKLFDEASYFGWEDDAMVPPVLDFIDAHRQERFFITMLTLTAHHPYSLPAGFQKKKRAAGRAFNDYLNTLTYVDRTLEKLFKGLEKRGILDDTAVIILGDHGEGFGEHGRNQHDATIFEEGIHIPMVMVGAGIGENTHVTGLRQNIDVLPTAVDLLGFSPVGGRFDGKSLLDKDGHDDITVWCHYRNYCSARLEQSREKMAESRHKDSILKTIYHYKKRGPQVFNLTEDPFEKRDLMGKSDAEKEWVQQRINEMISLRERSNRRYFQRTKTRVQRYVTSALNRAEVLALLEGPKAELGTHKFTMVDVKLDDFVTLLGFQQSTDVIEAGDQLILTTWYWVHKPLEDGWRTFHHISGPQHMNGDHIPVEGAYPVRRWKAGDVIEDHMIVSTRPDTIPGTYNVMTGMWNKKQKGRRAKAVKNGKRVHVKDEVEAPSFKIVRPRVDPADFVFEKMPEIAKKLQPDGLLDLAVGPNIRIRALGVEKPLTKGGLKTTLIYVYEVLDAPGPTSVYIDILGPSRLKRRAHIPVSGTWPTSKWKKGQWIVDRHEIITHTRHRLGKYDVMLGFTSLGADGRTFKVLGDDAHKVKDNMLYVGSYQLVR